MAQGTHLEGPPTPLFERLPAQSLIWLVAGGLSYTLGAAVFLLDSRVRYAHFLWHLSVMAGSACHVWAVVAHAARLNLIRRS